MIIKIITITNNNNNNKRSIKELKVQYILFWYKLCLFLFQASKSS
jgi:hypothetical protein